MGTEIGARNLIDVDRYDIAETVGVRMGLDMTSEQTLWRDRVVVEINRAVLHSFAAAGVTITDHHTESQRFLTHLAREERAGPQLPGGLELDRAADLGQPHSGLPPLLRPGAAEPDVRN